MGSHATPQSGSLQNGRPFLPPLALQPAGLAAVESGSNSGSGGGGGGGGGGGPAHFHPETSALLDGRDGRASGPTSAASQYSALSFAMGLRQPQGGTPDPASAAGSTYSDRGGSDGGGSSLERDDGLPDLDKLSLEKGRPLDVEDLDDAAWRAVSVEKRIVELGSLGEGAGGAVTRCILKGGKTVFALKVKFTPPSPAPGPSKRLTFPRPQTAFTDLGYHRSLRQTPIPT
jgi:mitogen-activated protein kinase kinase